MKRLWMAPMLALWLTGCMTLPKKESLPVEKPVALPTSPKKTVDPSSVTDANARQITTEFIIELDQAQNGLPTPPDQAPAKAK